MKRFKTGFFTCLTRLEIMPVGRGSKSAGLGALGSVPCNDSGLGLSLSRGLDHITSPLPTAVVLELACTLDCVGCFLCDPPRLSLSLFFLLHFRHHYPYCSFYSVLMRMGLNSWAFIAPGTRNLNQSRNFPHALFGIGGVRLIFQGWMHSHDLN